MKRSIGQYVRSLADSGRPWNAIRKTGIILEVIGGSSTIEKLASQYNLDRGEIENWLEDGLKAVEKTLQVPPPHEHTYADIVLDVGANSGQYATMIRKQGYKRRIVSFEPCTSAYTELLTSSRNDPEWQIHPRCALGASVSEGTLNVSQNSYSSSLLNLLPTHISAAPDSFYVSREQVEILTLDSIFNGYMEEGKRIMLKIDTQGYEDQVLAGALNALDRINIVRLELSLLQLYEGQKLYDYFIKFFKMRGFELWDIKSGFRNKKTGRLLQFDAVFMRPDN